MDNLKLCIDELLDFCKGKNSFIVLKNELLKLEKHITESKIYYGNNLVYMPIKDYPLYNVRSDGKVFNKKGNELKPFISSSGYYVISLCNGNKCKKYSIHRLIAISFMGKRSDDYVVNHIDKNKLNNHIDNLEWATYSQNLRHARRIK